MKYFYVLFSNTFESFVENLNESVNKTDDNNLFQDKLNMLNERMSHYYGIDFKSINYHIIGVNSRHFFVREDYFDDIKSTKISAILELIDFMQFPYIDLETKD